MCKKKLNCLEWSRYGAGTVINSYGSATYRAGFVDFNESAEKEPLWITPCFMLANKNFP
jgi:hypothetical protein